MASLLSTSSPSVGSSSTSAGGSCTTARAMDTRCRCPVESLPQSRSANSPRSNAATISSTRALAHLLGDAVEPREVAQQLARGEPLVQPHRRGQEAQPPPHLQRRRGRVEPVDARRARGGAQQRGQAAQRRGLPRAVGPQQRVHLAAAHAQRQLTHGRRGRRRTWTAGRTRSRGDGAQGWIRCGRLRTWHVVWAENYAARFSSARPPFRRRRMVDADASPTT